MPLFDSTMGVPGPLDSVTSSSQSLGPQSQARRCHERRRNPAVADFLSPIWDPAFGPKRDPDRPWHGASTGGHVPPTTKDECIDLAFDIAAHAARVDELWGEIEGCIFRIPPCSTDEIRALMSAWDDELKALADAALAMAQGSCGEG